MKKFVIYSVLAASALLVAASCHQEPVTPSAPKPKVLSLIPKAGYPGTEAVISGYGFTEPLTVAVDGVQASVKSVTNDRIYILMPEHELGTAVVNVNTGGVVLEGLSFRYAEPVEQEKLAVFSYSPTSGIEGDQITISGQLFSNKKERNSVSINGLAAEIVSANDSRLVVVLPDNPEGQYPFEVTVEGETVTGPMFTYNKKPELTVFSVTPNSGSEGDIVVLDGICFSGVPSENTVTLNGVQAEVLSATTTKLSVKIPENPRGSYPVVVTVGDKTFEGPAFMYVAKSHTYTVKTMSGSAGRAADATTLVDGGPTVAKFRQPRGVAFLPDGRLAILDNGNNCMRFMDMSTWDVTSSTATKSISNAGWRGAMHGDWFYYASKGNDKIIRYNYKTDVAEVLTATFTGTSPMDVAFDAAGNAYVLVRDGSKTIFKATGDDLSTLETFTTFADGPLAMEFDPEGNLIVTTNGCQVIGVKPDGTQFVIAGIRAGKANDPGDPGKPLTAKFGSNLFGMTLDKDGNIYVADDSFKIIKLITRGENGYEDAVVSTIAGTSGKSGKTDGAGLEASFNSPGEIRMDPSGKRLIVTEYNAYLIREILID
ncbi:MAG: IPT/TIG domain-containing protein [Bacteroidales bacterium]|nr:IPT/TIG domain-containing protein [Bacteroidales bacterium]